MKEYLQNLYRLTLMLVMVVLLQSCGGSSEEPTANFSISTNTNNISFSNELLQTSDDSFAIEVSFEGKGLLVGFAPDTEVAGWLEFRTENVTANSATIHVDVVNAENIFPNLYQTKLRVSTGDVDNLALVHKDIDISLLVWRLQPNTEKVSFSTTFGEASVADETVSLVTNENEWQVSTDAEWLSFDQAEGTGDADITFSADLSSFNEPGLYTADVTLTETTTGDSKTLPVEVALDNIYLYSNKSALLFSQLSDSQRLTQTIEIYENSPDSIQWQASTEQEWISLTPNSDDNTLTVSVNTNLLGSGEISEGQITVSATNAGYVKPLSLPITMFNKAIPNAKVVIDDLAPTSLVNSPSMPYTYVTVANELRAYHQYTGEMLSNLTLGSDEAQLDQLLVSPKGDFALLRLTDNVTDETTGETTQVVTRHRIDLSVNEATEIAEPTIEFEPVALVSIAGRLFVITQTMEFADIDLQRVYWDRQNVFSTSNVQLASATSTIFAHDAGLDSIKRFTTQINDFGDVKFTSTNTHTYRPEELEGSIADFIISANEANIYVNNTLTEWFSFDGDAFTNNGKLPQAEGNITLALAQRANGAAAFARFSPVDGFLFDLYDNSQQLEATILTEGTEQPTDLLISADDNRAVIEAAITDQVIFFNINQ